jgi:hypothetical protein
MNEKHFIDLEFLSKTIGFKIPGTFEKAIVKGFDALLITY